MVRYIRYEFSIMCSNSSPPETYSFGRQDVTRCNITPYDTVIRPKTFLLPRPFSYDTAAETAIQPLLWCFYK